MKLLQTCQQSPNTRCLPSQHILLSAVAEHHSATLVCCGDAVTGCMPLHYEATVDPPYARLTFSGAPVCHY